MFIFTDKYIERWIINIKYSDFSGLAEEAGNGCYYLLVGWVNVDSIGAHRK